VHLFYQPDIPNGSNFLTKEESAHCLKVLRMATGDHMQLTDGQGVFYKAVITTSDAKKCEFEIISQDRQKEPSYRIDIAIAPTKNIARIEWFVEKCVELGVNGIHFVRCAHSERNKINMDRVDRKAVSAMKQSLKAWKPSLNGLISFEKFIMKVKSHQKFIAHVDNDNPTSLFKSVVPGSGVTVIIGPEGDFSDREIEDAVSRGFYKVSLGESRLRTETAGIVACNCIHLANEIR
jgi:16S rRNA (uracil1498-N3)-methyltransferase